MLPLGRALAVQADAPVCTTCTGLARRHIVKSFARGEAFQSHSPVDLMVTVMADEGVGRLGFLIALPPKLAIPISDGTQRDPDRRMAILMRWE